MASREMLDGNGAATEALRLARVKVISAYPITPQSPIAEKLASYVASGEMDARYIRVESEHSAMSCAVGAQLTGIRAGTATSSVGLALMYEILNVASGLRLPIVMPVVNRALVAPWSLWCDHQDTMAARDAGWLQLYAQNAQEVLDLLLCAYRWGEDERVLLPVMVGLDGFFLSHAIEPVSLPDQREVDGFLPPYEPKNLVLDVDNPVFINNLTPPTEFTEMKYQHRVAMDQALSVLPEVFGQFEKGFGRSYRLTEAYRCADARAVLVAIGSSAGTARFTVDRLRDAGKKVGMLKVTAFRPFPAEEVRKALSDVPVVGVLDRSSGLGGRLGPVATEVRSALMGDRPVIDFFAGFGGRDLPIASVEKAFAILLNADKTAAETDQPVWLDVHDNALTIREVGANA